MIRKKGHTNSLLFHRFLIDTPMFRLQHQQTRTLFMMASSRIKPMPNKAHWIKLATFTKPVVR